ncbi:MAG: VWA domain-containing protein, partial [Planctomycetota bacterium]
MNLPRLGFETPGYLWLVLVLPFLIAWSWTRLAVLGKRRWLATIVRSLVWLGLVLSLAGVQVVWISDRVTVMYVLDQSESIPVSVRGEMLDYVITAVRRHRNAARGDQAGVIAFGRDATIEVPPFDDDIPAAGRLESLLERTDATNLEGALNLAQASMPEDTARRIVIITDGNENVGESRRVASRVVAAGIGIDVVPIETESGSEIMVEKIDLPTNIRRGQPFEARVVIDRTDLSPLTQSRSDEDTPDDDDQDGQDSSDTVSGRLRVTQTVDGEASLLLEQTVTLDRGKNVFPLRHKIDQPAAFTYEATFLPDDRNADGLKENNVATGYTYVRGKGRVLMIYPADQLLDYELLLSTLRDANIETVPMASDQLFTSLASLQPFDSVILAGVPRVSGEDVASISSFSDVQIDMLVRNTQQLGAGLIMLGGPEALGAGGWTGTEIEKAMPVDFKIRNTKVQAVGALALIMHASEMPKGNYWQKVIAKAAIEQLGGADYAGLLHWTATGDDWMWGGSKGLLPVGPNRRAMLAAIGRMTPGDMPQFDPAMRMAVAGLSRAPASVKHCIIISDG